MKKLSIFLLILIAFLLVSWFSGVFTEPMPTISKVQISASSSTPTVLTENTLATFSSTTIEVRCPFYKLNGAEYRDCLSSWVDELNNDLLVEQLDEVESYCSVFVKKVSNENSIEGGELYLRCEIYKLQ